ncbi:membrane protein [Sphingomonas metalli]|uniref:Membrane protein n=1 Tax=Sphingomonas metalli TaxID=1779358 RepID=A0A916WSR5_9SPHN|nr:membrane protein [Sphingomonas metalli]
MRGGSAFRALALLGAGLGATVAATPAIAQDYTSGAIGGTVLDDAGRPVANAVVNITSVAQGTARTARSNGSGSFLINGLPIGAYTVKVDAPNAPSWRADDVRILAGQTAQLNIALAASGSDDIVVTGTRAVASFTGTTTGLNVDVTDFIANRPLGRDLTSVILLAPGTTAGNSSNSTFNGLPSIGGSSVAENAYYLNGLNLTNFDNYLGGAKVPFFFYQGIEIKNGGYQPEYGRATGGIVNAVTKSGTNDFTAAVHLDWSPNFLRSPSKNTLSWDGSAYTPNTNRRADKADNVSVTVEAGGPIIKDRLFVYGLAQFQRATSIDNSPRAGTAYSYKNDDPFWGVKIDAYPFDSQHLELTVFDTRNTNERSDLTYSTVNGKVVYGTATAVTGFKGGGLNYVGKYTGSLTDWLTVSAAYGRVRDRFDQVPLAGAGNLPAFSNASGATTYGVPNGGYYNGQRLGSNDVVYSTERKFFRADADILFTLLGNHHLRGGYDQENNTLEHVTVRNGGAFQFSKGYISQAAYDAVFGGAGVQYIARAANANGPVVELNYFNTGGTFKAKNKAFYIQDEWKPFSRLTLNLGARRDDFRINKPSGNTFADLSKNYAPRVGAEYRLFGDRSGKLFGSYGWYYLPIASNTAFRQGAPSYYIRQRYNFTGVRADGTPILGGLVTNNGSYQAACPFALLPGGALTNCNVTGDGSDINTTQGVAANLKATRQSEFIAGYEQKAGLWTFGVSYTHRNLDRTAEDSAVDAAINAYCTANGIVARPTKGGAAVPCSTIWSGYHQYVINNPGKAITVNLLATGYDINNRTVNLSADALGYGKAKRTYDAVVFSFDRKWDGMVSFGGSYTWSKSKGNSEGYVQSDFGQSDSGITQDFDQPGFVDYSYGNLPNDRRHIIKAFGNVALGEQLVLGLNTEIKSPASLSCFGFHPKDVFANGYGAASHYCGGKPSPRGSAQKSDWFETINLAVRYNAKIADRQLTLRADVFNLLNSQAVLGRVQTGDLDVVSGSNNLPTSYIPDPNYGLASLYQPRRYVRLGLDIAF